MPTNADASSHVDASLTPDTTALVDALAPTDASATSMHADTFSLPSSAPTLKSSTTLDTWIKPKPAAPAATAPAVVPPQARYSSVTEMLALANMKLVPVVGDGNCGFYAYLGTRGKLQHSKRVPLGMPSAADYAAQQELRVKCVHWLQNEGSGVTAYQFGSDRPTASI